MLNNQPYYHKVFKNAIIAFGILFSNLKIVREDADKILEQTIQVPIAYAPKEKWIVRIDSDPDLTNNTYITLPRMSFEIVGVQYDVNRKVNRMNKIACPGTASSPAKYTYAPIPYNLSINLYILTKTQEDGFQIIEQILPLFNPDYTLSVKSLEDLNVVTDIPVILNDIRHTDEYDGSFETRRFVTWELSFTMKLNLFGKVNEQGLIEKVIININEE